MDKKIGELDYIEGVTLGQALNLAWQHTMKQKNLFGNAVEESGEEIQDIQTFTIEYLFKVTLPLVRRAKAEYIKREKAPVKKEEEEQPKQEDDADLFRGK